MVPFGINASADRNIPIMVDPAPSPPSEKDPKPDVEEKEDIKEEAKLDEEPPKERELPIARDMTETPPPIMTGKRKRTNKRGKIGKKPADMPRRPLSGYNYFFSEQRSKILEEQSKVKDEKHDIFTTLGRIVADRWKKLGDKDKEKFLVVSLMKKVCGGGARKCRLRKTLIKEKRSSAFIPSLFLPSSVSRR